MRVTLQEIQQVLVDEGYSANQRQAWLKEVLTELELHAEDPTGDEKKLIEDVKDVIGELQDNDPISDDIL